MKKVLPDSPKRKVNPDWYKLSDGKWHYIPIVEGKIFFDGLFVKNASEGLTSAEFLLPDEIGEL